MIIAVLLTALYFVVGGLLGLAIVALSGRGMRDLLVLAPVLGVSLAVAVLHTQSLVAGVAAATLVVPFVALLLLAVGLVLRRSLWGPIRPALAEAWPAWVAGTIAASLALVPSVIANTQRVVMPLASHDAFYYVEVARWLAGHPGTALPDMAGGPADAVDPPVFGPAWGTLTVPLRFGQELYQAWLSSITGIDLIDGFTPWLAASVGMIAIAASFLLRRLGLARLPAATGGLAAGLSSCVLDQSVAQNADSLIGIAIAIAAVAAVIWRFAQAEQQRGSIWLAALLLTAMVGTYSELLVFAGPVLVVVVLFGRFGGLLRRVAQGLAIVALAAVMSPFAWFRAAQSLIFMGGFAGASPGPMPVADVRAALVGSLSSLVDAAAPTSLHSRAGQLALVLIGVAAALGWISALLMARTRAVTIGVVVFGALVLAYLASRGNAYMFARATDLLIPLAVPIAAAGLFGFGEFAARRGWVAIRRVLTVAAVGALALWMGAGVQSLRAQVGWDWSHRIVDDDFVEAGDWVDRVADRSGGNISVAVPDFFEQLWVVDQLRDLPDVSYPFLRGDLGYLGSGAPQTYVDPGAAPRRYLLVGRGVDLDAPDAAVLERNDRFQLVDLGSTNSFAVVAPEMPNPSWNYNIEDSPSDRDVIGARGAIVSIDLGPSVSAVSLTILAPDGRPSAYPFELLGLPEGWSAVAGDAGEFLITRQAQSATEGSAMLGMPGDPLVDERLLVDGVEVVSLTG